VAAPLVLMAEPRTALGKKNGAIRREGKVPGVVYGPGYEQTIQVQVDRREFERFYVNTGLNKPFTLPELVGFVEQAFAAAEATEG